ncbi:hypothetical protein Peur_045599 [Populus x canadensis]
MLHPIRTIALCSIVNLSQVIKFLLLVALLSCAFIEVGGHSFRYPTFHEDSKTDFISHNSAIVINAIQATPNVKGDSIAIFSGCALYRKQFKLWAGEGRVRATFNSTFVLDISPQTKPGGEGITFILTADSGLPENRQGRWLGIVNATTNGAYQAKIVAVEFDTRKSYKGDIDSN